LTAVPSASTQRPAVPSRAQALILLLAPLIWGLGFVATKATLAGLAPIWSNTLRFVLAACLLLPFAWKELRTLESDQIRIGLGLGLCLFAVFSLQTQGLLWTSVSRSSFITGLYAVFTPLVGVLPGLGGSRPKRATLGALAAALIGLYLLTWSSSEGSLGLNRGDLLTLGCALACAFHIALAGRASRTAGAFALNFLQLSVVAVLSLGTALTIEGPLQFQSSPTVILGLAYLVVFSSGVAFTLQFYAQRRMSPTAAAMIFLLEAPFGALAGVLLMGDRLTVLQTAGAALMLAASAWAVSVDQA
jgi:drug/metabolite transporter (DMT)-like permease